MYKPFIIGIVLFFMAVIPANANDQVIDYGQIVAPYCGYQEEDYAYVCVKVFGEEVSMLMGFEDKNGILEKIQEGMPVLVTFRTVMVEAEPGSDEKRPHPVADELKPVN